MRIRGWTVAMALLGSIVARAASAQTTTATVVEGVSIVDVRGDRVVPDRVIVIEGDTIRAVGSASSVRVPRGARRIDGKGAFVIPGLWDMHVHLTDATELALPVLIAHGVTGVRDMGGDLKRLDAWRREAAAGARLAPHIVRAGPYLDGVKDAPYHLAVTGKDDADRIVDSLAAAGVDFIKVHNGVPRDAYFAILERATLRGKPVCGHVPLAIAPEEAVAAGQADIEHFATLFEGTYRARFANEREAFMGMSAWLGGSLDTLAAAMARRHTAFTPTLVAYRKRAERGRLAQRPEPEARWVASSLRRQWDAFSPVSDRDTTAAVVQARMAFVKIGEQVVAKLRHADVPILAGTDLGARDVVPGASLHEELALLVESGLTPAEALASATIEPASFFGNAAVAGTVEPGRRADLVLLDRNPLADIGNTRAIRGVMLAGAYYGRAELDRLLEASAASAAGD